jgi:hypothetical protein
LGVGSAEQSFFFRATEMLKKDSSMALMKICEDNFQLGNQGITSSYGSTLRSRFVAGTDALAVPWAKTPTGDPFKLELGEVAWSTVVDRAVITTGLMGALASLPFLPALEVPRCVLPCCLLPNSTALR